MCLRIKTCFLFWPEFVVFFVVLLLGLAFSAMYLWWGIAAGLIAGIVVTRMIVLIGRGLDSGAQAFSCSSSSLTALSTLYGVGGSLALSTVRNNSYRGLLTAYPPAVWLCFTSMLITALGAWLRAARSLRNSFKK